MKNPTKLQAPSSKLQAPSSKLQAAALIAFAISSLPMSAGPPTADDLDGDGIPNVWESSHFLSPTDPDDAASDFDLDGLTAWQEYSLSLTSGGQSARPQGKWKASTLPPPVPANGATVDNVTLIECATNGTLLAEVRVRLPGTNALRTRPFTWSPDSGQWLEIQPPSGFEDTSSFKATDVNSSGQVVGEFQAGYYVRPVYLPEYPYYYESVVPIIEGFIWTPAGQGGGSSEIFALDTANGSPALPTRIGDTGDVVGKVPALSNRTFAADHTGREIVFSGQWTAPVFHDVNAYGEFVGTIYNPLEFHNETFLAMEGQPVFMSGIQSGIEDVTGPWAELPDIDRSSIVWDEDTTGSGNFQYGTGTDRINGLSIPLHQGYGNDFYWAWDLGASGGGWFLYPEFKPVFGAVNNWGEFAGNWSAKTSRTTFDELGHPDTYSWSSTKGLFLYDGAYHTTQTANLIYGIADDRRVLIGQPFAFWSDGVSVSLRNLIPSNFLTSTRMTRVQVAPGKYIYIPVVVQDQPTRVRAADCGRVYLQGGQHPTAIYLLEPDQDADGDGMPDDWESFYGLNPNDSSDRTGDADNDGVPNYLEFRFRSIPATPIPDYRPGIDTDGDGMPDVWEWKYGFDSNNPADAALDFDADGLSNLQEFHLGTDPCNPDTDGDGMTDGLELAAGFDINNADENHNGKNDGYEDFDNDGYINREEALCGTDARVWDSRPDGTSYSIVGGAANGGTGSWHPVLLVRNYTIETQEIRDASFQKQGERGFLPGIVVLNSPSMPVPVQGEYVESAPNDRPRYYLANSTVEEESDIGYFDYGDVLDGKYDFISTGTLTTTEVTSKQDGDYSTGTSKVGSAAFTERFSGGDGEPPSEFTSSYSLPDGDWPLYFCYLGDAFENVLSDTAMKTVYTENHNNSFEGYSDERKINNSETVTLSEEYTDARLLGDLGEELAAADWRSLNQYGSHVASFLWDNPYTILAFGIQHASAEFKDVKYRLVSNATGEIPSTTVVKFMWKEVFIPQEGEGGEIKVKWFEEKGALVESSYFQPGQFATTVHELKHPENPGTIVPNYNRSGINAPNELSALNPGETPKLSRTFTNSQSNPQTELTIQKGKPITFQTDLADQNNNPTFAASGTGAVVLWERKKDGTWQSHPLPFPIPAEQSAGPSSDPGSYVIQGTTPGNVTLQITSNGTVRAEAQIEIRQVDLDIDSDNSGDVNRSDDEETIEEDSSQPGKILPGGDALESDANGIPLHPEKLTSLKLQIANIPSYGSITFNYPDKAINLWKTPTGQTPASDDLIVPGQSYAPTDLGISPGSTAEFSVQAIGSGLGLVRIGISCSGAEDGVLVNFPIKVMDNAFATGVDDVSCTAKSTDAGYQADTWIMAPSGTVPGTSSPCVNDSLFKITPSTGFQLHVAAPAAGQFTATPDNFPAQGQTLSPEEWPVVGWHGESADTADVTPVWTVTPTQGSPATITLPVKVKVMKNRNVKVVVHYVTGKQTKADGTIKLSPPTAQPTPDEIKEKLRNVFSRQINVWFEDLVCKPEVAEWDIGKDENWGTTLDPMTGNAILPYDRELDLGGSLSITDPSSVEEVKLLTLQNITDSADIDVFVIGGCWNIHSYIGLTNGELLDQDRDLNFPYELSLHPGITKREHRAIYIAGEKVIVEHPLQKDLLLQDIAHEIGHILIGPGHPDDLKDSGVHAGAAPLQGTNTLERLMFSDETGKKNAGTLDRNLLVKKEWDAAEVWLLQEENAGRL